MYFRLSFIFALAFILPATAKALDLPYNTNLNQLNIAEILNLRADASAELKATIFRLDGTQFAERQFTVAPGGTYHLILNAIKDAEERSLTDTYGLVRIAPLAGNNATGDSSVAISASMMFYRMSPTSATPEYFFAMPARDPLRGESYGMYNSINPGQGQPVWNYISVANPDSLSFRGRLVIYRQDGTTQSETLLEISPSGRVDVAAGHPLGSTTGTYAIIPDNALQPYHAFSVRYSAADGKFNFAFPLAAHKGACGDLLPASTMGFGTHNWLELGNMGDSARQVAVSVLDRSGQQLVQQGVNMPARGQGNFYVNPYIGAQSVGSVTTACSSGDKILAQSAYYIRESLNSDVVGAAYVSEGLGVEPAGDDEVLVLSANTFLGDAGRKANWIKVGNRANQAGVVEFEVRNQFGTVVQTRTLNIQPLGTLDVAVHELVGDDFYGPVRVRALTTGLLLSAELLRVFTHAGGEPLKIANIPSAKLVLEGPEGSSSSSLSSASSSAFSSTASVGSSSSTRSSSGSSSSRSSASSSAVSSSARSSSSSSAQSSSRSSVSSSASSSSAFSSSSSSSSSSVSSSAPCDPSGQYTQIYTASQFRAMTDPRGRYILCADIDLGGNSPMLYSETPFNGILEGNGRRVSGVSISQGTTIVVGLFRTIGRDGVIRNLDLISPSVSAMGMAGAMVGVSGGTLSNIDIIGGNVSATLVYAGGLAGVQQGGTVTNCTSTAVVSAPSAASNQLIGASQ